MKNKPQALTSKTTKAQPAPTTLPGSKSVYENKSYQLVIGIPPVTQDMPNPIDAYLIVNKETGVIESWHSILFYAKQTADHLHSMLIDPPGKKANPWDDAQEERSLPGEKKPSGTFN